MNLSILKAPPNQGVKFVELFFDVIFVFIVVQIVEVIRTRFDFLNIYKAIVLFWLIWWIYTQFTYTLNVTDTETDVVEIIILIVTAISFIMAISIPYAYNTEAVPFMIAYVSARLIALVLYLAVSSNYGQKTFRVVAIYSILSLISIVLVIIGALVEREFQLILWSTAVVFDILNIVIVGRYPGWVVQSSHMAERFGLFMIIVLGETLLINASGLVGAFELPSLQYIPLLAIMITLLLWWSYFARIKDKLEQVMKQLGPDHNSNLARDVYSLGHFPIILGIMFYASGLEEIVLSRNMPITSSIRLSLGTGFLLYNAGITITIYRAIRRILHHRYLISILVMFAVVYLPVTSSGQILSIILVGLVFINLFELRRDNLMTK